jgi:hypothetical protein
MGRDLADWNRGMGDAGSGRLAASGRSRDYYDGYYYACAVNYEYIGALPEFAGEGDLSQISSDSATVAASGFNAQLNRLNSRLLASHGASLPAGAGPDAVCTAGDEAALRDHDAELQVQRNRHTVRVHEHSDASVISIATFRSKNS